MDNVATFGLNVATFQRVKQPTLQRCREGIFQRRDVPETGKTDVTMLRANVATLQRRPKSKFPKSL